MNQDRPPPPLRDPCVRVGVGSGALYPPGSQLKAFFPGGAGFPHFSSCPQMPAAEAKPQV